MSPDDLYKVRAIFEAALELAHGERRAFLDEACGETVSIRQEVVQLLAAHDKTDAWIDHPASEYLVEASPETTAPVRDRQFGSYRVVRELGHGGMGSVYLAERMIGKVCQQVAIKVIRPGRMEFDNMR